MSEDFVLSYFIERSRAINRDNFKIKVGKVKEFIRRRINDIQEKLDTKQEAFARYELLELLQKLNMDLGEMNL